MRRARASGNPVSLFPFLAVLVSAMGALILLLLVVSRQAQRTRDREYQQRRSPTEIVAPATPPLPLVESYTLPPAEPLPPVPPLVRAQLPPLPDLVDRRDELKRRQQDLHNARNQARAALAETQTGSRTESADLRTLDIEIESMREKLDAIRLDTETADAKLKRLSAELDSAKQRLDQAQELSASVENRFAIVPYFGPNATPRRPIYLECRYDRIVLMPEGIAITAELLSNPTSPENPLATMLRTLRGVVRSEGDRPYPLLVVRPDGVAAFYVARAALATIEDEYGYELVDDSVTIEYGAPRQRMREAAESVVRSETRRIMASGSRGRPAFTLESTLPPGIPNSVLGGPDRGDGEGSALADSESRLPDQIAPIDGELLEAAGRRLALPNGILGHVRSPSNRTGIPSVGEEPFQLPPMQMATGAPIEGTPSTNEAGNPDAMSSHQRNVATASRSQRDSPTHNDMTNPTVFQSQRDGDRPMTLGSPTPDARPTAIGAAKAAAQSAPKHVPDFAAENNGGGAPPATTEFEQYLASLGTPGGSPSSQPPQLQSSSQAEAGPRPAQAQGSAQSASGASEAGAQALLPTVGPTISTHTAASKRVVVEVRREGLILYPGKKFVPFAQDPSLQAAKRAIYEHVADQMMGWGKPAKAQRWTPIVELDVRPDALDRYYDLRFALAGSGLEVDRRLIGWKDQLEFSR